MLYLAIDQRTKTINRARQILRRHNLQHDQPTKGFQTQAARKWLTELELSPLDRLTMDHLLEQWKLWDQHSLRFTCPPAAKRVRTIRMGFLRHGRSRRLPTKEPLAPADYFAFVCRREQLPQITVYAWSLKQPLPKIPVPLQGGEPDAAIDLQSIIQGVYDRAGFAYALDDSAALAPPLNNADAAWAAELLKQQRG